MKTDKVIKLAGIAAFVVAQGVDFYRIRQNSESIKGSWRYGEKLEVESARIVKAAGNIPATGPLWEKP